MQTSLSYAFLDAAVLLGVFVLTWQHAIWRTIVSRWFMKRVALLFFGWCIVDWVACSYLHLWQFPAGTTLPFRVIGLPLEEYTVFVVHTVLTLATLRVIRSE